jgi:hypothetical protein
MLTAISFKADYLLVTRKPSRLEPGVCQIRLADQLSRRRPVGAKSYVFSAAPKREAGRAINGIAHAEWLFTLQTNGSGISCDNDHVGKADQSGFHATERYTSNRSPPPPVSTLAHGCKHFALGHCGYFSGCPILRCRIDLFCL